MNRVKKPLYLSDKRRGRPERRKRPLKRIVINREMFAWAAGIADGEGSFCNTKPSKSHTKRFTFAVGQVDRRMLDRFQRAVQMGKVYGPYGPYGVTQLPNSQPAYHLHIYGFEQVQALLALLWTWLGPVKRQQAIAMLYNKVGI